MKKQISFAAFIALVLISIFACQKDLFIDNPSMNADLKSLKSGKDVEPQAIVNPVGDIIINSNVPHERGFAGPGAWFPGRVGFNNCNKPQGICQYEKLFGGGEKPVWKAQLLDREHIRLESIVELVMEFENQVELIKTGINDGNIWTSDPSVEMNDEFAEKLADFVQNNFNVPKYIPFATEVNNRFVEIAGFPDGTQLYTVPGEYEIKRDAEHPNGYFDMKIFVKTPNSNEPPYSDCYWEGQGANRRWVCR